MTAVEIAEIVQTWPSARDAAVRLGITHNWALRLIERGELRAARTRLGMLVEPASLEACAHARQARKAARSAC